MTDIDMAALEALEAAATPGPWRADFDLPVNRKPRIDTAEFLIGEIGNSQPMRQDQWEADAAFIAAIRNEATALIAAVKERDEAIREVNTQIEYARQERTEVNRLRALLDEALAAKPVRCGYCDGTGRDKTGQSCGGCAGTGTPAIFRRKDTP